jgi:hypothetical protein
MRPDLAAVIVGLIAVVVGVLGLFLSFFASSWYYLGTAAPYILIGIGALVLIMALRRR